MRLARLPVVNAVKPYRLHRDQQSLYRVSSLGCTETWQISNTAINTVLVIGRLLVVPGAFTQVADRCTASFDFVHNSDLIRWKAQKSALTSLAVVSSESARSVKT